MSTLVKIARQKKKRMKLAAREVAYEYLRSIIFAPFSPSKITEAEYYRAGKIAGMFRKGYVIPDRVLRNPLGRRSHS